MADPDAFIGYAISHYRIVQKLAGGMAVVVFLSACFLFQVIADAQVREIRRVLVLNDLGIVSSPGFAEVDQAVYAGLQKSPYQIEFYEESLELTLFPDEVSQRRFREEFIRKYSGRKLDVIIAARSDSLKFIAESHETFLRDTPIIFCGILGEIPDRLRRDVHFTGVLGRLQPGETLNAALRLLPGTKHVVVTGGIGKFDFRWEAIAKQSFHNYESKLDFTYLTDLTMPTLLERLRNLPDNTIVYHTAISQDAAGGRFIDSAQSVPLLASAANAPVFVVDDVDLREGTVGGDLVNWADDARVAAGMAVRVLNGEKPQDIPIVTGSNAYMFDWRALRRWGLKQSDLPPGSVVLNRPPSLWQLYKRYVLASVFVLLAQTLAIFALLWQRARKRETEKSLAERLAFETLLSDLSGTFIEMPEEQVTSNIAKSFGRIGEFLKLDRITLFEASQEGAELTVTSSWSSEGTQPAPPDSKPIPWPWWTSRGLSGEPVTFSNSHVVSEETTQIRRYLLESGIESIASVPLRAGGEIVGALSFVSSKRRGLFTEDLVRRLKVIAEIFSNALKRKRAMHALLASNFELKKSEYVLRESEERLRMAIQAGRMYAFEWDAVTDVIVRSPECVHIFNWMDDPTHDSGKQFAARVHPDDRDTYATEGTTGLTPDSPTYQTSYRVLRPDGSVIWLEATGRAFFDGKGTMLRIVGMAVDATERKQAEEALASVSRRLIEAHEEERTWIARELHDDINQRIALLSVNLQCLKQDRAASASDRSRRMGQACELISDLGNDVQALSHRLHSSKLEYLGLVAAAEGFCGELSDQQRVEINFHSEDIPKNLPQEIALCLFRVLQEALQNAVKHSGVRQFQVLLKAASNEIQLSVHDSGVGFDPERAMTQHGLGLTSMKERLKLVDGTVSIDSNLQSGTIICARVPLAPRTKYAGAGG